MQTNKTRFVEWHSHSKLPIIFCLSFDREHALNHTNTYINTHTHLIVYPKRSFDALFVLCSCLLVLFDQNTIFDFRRVRS